jgi:hypothetical protein
MTTEIDEDEREQAHALVLGSGACVKQALLANQLLKM